MNPRTKLLGILAGGAVVLLGVAYLGYQRVYAGPVGEARADLVSWRNRARAYERDLEQAPAVGARLRAVGATTLGTTQEEVAHAFRSLLHEMGTVAGLSGITITEGRTGPELNPATSRFRLQGFDRDTLRTSDFYVMNGDVRGVGSLEAVARLLTLCDTQAWIHRVSSFSVTPVNDERDEFEVKVSVATLILPDVGPREGAGARVMPLEPGAEGAWASIVAKNVFRVPEAPAVAAAPVAPTPTAVEEVPPAPPPQPYHEWVLSGVMEGSTVTVVMVNAAKNQSLTLGVGESVLDARLVWAGGEAAVFAIGDREYEVRLQESLADRRDVDGSDGV